MENLQLYSKIYELKGIVESLSLLADIDENYNNPVIERLEEQMIKIIQIIENTSA
jgi:hypothetical protein